MGSLKTSLSPITLTWVVYFHQPLGNFPEVYDRYVQLAIRPFLDALVAAGEIKVTLHFSGPVLATLEENHPTTFEVLRSLVRLGQVEILGGGYYCPIFSLIPESDALRQLEKLSDYLEQELGQTPRGAWLPQSVWEPRFASILARAGLSYSLLDESLFLAAGHKRAHLTTPFFTQHLNDSLTVFPIHAAWSRQVPYLDYRDLKAQWVQLAHRPEGQVITLAQPGEAYGLWEGTHRDLYEAGGMQRWLEFLSREAAWVQTSTLGEVAKREAWSLTYLPAGAPAEVESASLHPSAHAAYLEASAELQRRFDADRFLPYFRAGSWMGFLSKYPEAHLMQKKLLWLHSQLGDLPRGRAREHAHELLLAAQEHSAYWMTNSGGIAANYLRDAVYQHLCAAEQIFMAAEPESAPCMLEVDYNGDGQREVLLRSELVGLIVTPRYGGSVCDLSFWPTNFNLANSFRRRPDPLLAKVAGAPQPIEDQYERRMFQDRFFAKTLQPTDLVQGTYTELGTFLTQPYQVTGASYAATRGSVALERRGSLLLGGELRPFHLQKTYTLTEPGSLRVDYLLQNIGTIPIDLLFAMECNFTLLDGDSPQRTIRCDGQVLRGNQVFTIPYAKSIEVLDDTRGLEWTWSCDPAATVWHYPVHTVVAAPPLYRSDYQGSALLVVWHVTLAAAEQIQLGVSQQFAVQADYIPKRGMLQRTVG